MIYSKLKKAYLIYKTSKSLKKHFRKKFIDKKKNIGESKILLEFNAFHSYHVPVAYFSNFLKNKFQSELVGYFNYKILSSPFEENFLNKLKWIIGNSLNLKNFSIFRSFGVNEIIKPKLKKSDYQNAKSIFINIKSKVKTKNDILNIEINNIKIGDLIYDTYLKTRYKPTIELNEDFFIMLYDFCKLFLFWENYIKSNKIKVMIGVHTCYSYGLPLRIALKNKIPTYCVNFRKINQLSENMRYVSGEFVNFKKNFLKLNDNEKNRGKILAKERLDNRIDGVAGVKTDIISSEVSSFGKKFFDRKISKNDRFKVAIFPHDFFDAVHAYGDTLFEDFYEWLEYLGKISKKTDYDWYIKNRPNYPGKFQIYQPHTENIINNFVKKYPHIKKLPNNYPHNQIVSEGINGVLTAYGSVALEYAYLGIPVINASINNPHCNYSFCLNPKDLKEYENTILNIKNINLEIKKSEIYEYYYMRNIYTTKIWLIDDLNDFMSFVGGYSDMNSYKFYEYWLNNLSKKKEERLDSIFKNFINSEDDAINILHTSI